MQIMYLSRFMPESLYDLTSCWGGGVLSKCRDSRPNNGISITKIIL